MENDLKKRYLERTVRIRAALLYVRLRRAYRRHGVLPYPRRETWREAQFACRISASVGRPITDYVHFQEPPA